MNGSLFSTPDDRPAPAAYIRVAVERGIDRPADDAGLTYAADWPCRVGDRVEVPLGRGDRPTGGVVIAAGGDELLAGLRAGSVKRAIRPTGARLPEPLVSLARWMSEYYVCPLGMTLATMVPGAVKKPAGRGGTAGKKPETATDAAAPPIASTTPPDPTPEQSRAIAGIAGSLGRFAVHLVFGVTGSGKTEVYLRAIDAVLGRGGRAIVLVPEISLTPQTSSRFLDRFGAAGVVVLHSGLTPGHRRKAWTAIAGGGASVVVGARSAVFAPIDRLGLIVVDEEHATDYKQDQLPRYHGRDVAIKRAQIESCPVVLGSATPSLESWANASGGRPGHLLWELPRRVGPGRLPRVVIADMAAERGAGSDPAARATGGHAGGRHAGGWPVIGTTLESALAETLAAGGQAILLLNRRGYASVVLCATSSCGWVMGCDECDATLVLHRGRSLPARGVLRCHHCTAEQRPPAACPVCGGPVTALGMGTQRAEDDLVRLFGPGAGRVGIPLIEGDTLIRVDGDTMGSARDYVSALGRFAEGRARVLLGTQMIAKGLDFPGVRLVGVINADTALALPDFRASERTFQLVCQVAGRAGRGREPGLVVVQTLRPADPAIAAAAAHDYRGFAGRELRWRRAAGLPPATRMARIVLRDRDRAAAEARAGVIAAALKGSAGRGVRVAGPMPAPISRVAGHHRVAVEVLAPTAAAMVALLSGLRRRGELVSDARTAIDVDPVSML